MKLLLDTHALLWWLTGNVKLSGRVRRAIEKDSGQIGVSAASGWEIATKARLGKLPEAMQIAHRLRELVAEQGFPLLPITFAEGERAGWLPGPHGDPFDRMLAAHALMLDIPIATRDRQFEIFGVDVIW